MDENDVRYEGWRVVAASSLGVFIASLHIYTLPVFLKPLSEEFAWSREEVSTAYSVAAAMVALTAAPVGRLCDRWGTRLVALPAVIIVGIAYGSLITLSANLWHLYAVFAILGVALIGTSPLVYARAITTWFDRRRGLALAIAISGGSVGGMVHPPMAQALMERFGWRFTTLVLGALVLAIVLPTVALFIRDRPDARSASPGMTGAAGVSVAEGLRSYILWILALVIFIGSVAQNGALVHLPALLTDRGVPPDRAAVALATMGAASVAGRLLTGVLIDRYFAPRVSFVMLLLVAAGAWMLATADSFATGTLAAALIGVGMGGESDVAPYLVSRYFGLQSFSTLYGVVWIAVASAGVVGPILMARAFDGTGTYHVTLTWLAVVIAATALFVLLLPRYDAIRRAPQQVHLTADARDFH